MNKTELQLNTSIKKAIRDENAEWIEDYFKTNPKKIDKILNPEEDLDEEGEMTPLLLALKEGATEIVNILLQLGANPNLGNKWGYPMHLLVRNKDLKTEIILEMAKKLIEYKANLTPTLKFVSPALLCFWINSEEDSHARMVKFAPKLLELFLDSGFDISTVEIRDSDNKDKVKGTNIISYMLDLYKQKPCNDPIYEGKTCRLILGHIKKRAKKEVSYKGCTKQYEIDLRDFILKFMPKVFEPKDHVSINRDQLGLMQDYGFYNRSENRCKPYKAFCVMENLIYMLFIEVFLPVREDTLEHQRKKIAFMSGFHKRLGENSVLSGPAFKQNVLFSRDPIKLIFKYVK